MEWQQIRETLAALPAAEQRTYTVGALVVVALMALVLLLESQYFRRTRRVGSWAVLRLVSLVMAPLTFAAIVMPARAVSGMEGLAVFYACLLTVGPLLWFGSHLLCAKRLRPAVSEVEAVVLACIALAIVALPVIGFRFAEESIREAARGLSGRPTPGASAPAHRATPVVRRSLPGAGVVFTQSLIAPPGVILERVERRHNGPWYDAMGVTNNDFCRHGQDLHLMWSAEEAAPELRLHWRNAAGQPQAGEHLARGVPLPEGGDRPFAIAARPDGIDPEAPIPRSRVFFNLTRADGTQTSLLPKDTRDGRSDANGCLMPGDVQFPWSNVGSLASVNISFRPQSGKYARAVVETGSGPAAPAPAR
ncbi:MAG: hypothetical protein JNM79_15720 [Burkholderiales bacterium]|nr:hypothetical protein [Burkholderiales bacterium]